jgi:hypothetical protein
MHHLDEEGVVDLFGELGRVARGGVIINDLERGPVYLFFAWLLGFVFTRNPITRHDGPLSVRRAYHPDELVPLAKRAGLAEVARVRGFIGHRYAIVFERAPAEQLT